VGLTAEMRRSAVAIPANFATGAGGTRDDEYVRNVASGHAHIAELMTYAEIAERLGYLNQRQTTELRGKAEHLDMEVRSFRQALARAQQLSNMQHATETRHASRPQHGL
jgi:four helix bundle protein